MISLVLALVVAGAGPDTPRHDLFGIEVQIERMDATLNKIDRKLDTFQDRLTAIERKLDTFELADQAGPAAAPAKAAEPARPSPQAAAPAVQPAYTQPAYARPAWGYARQPAYAPAYYGAGYTGYRTGYYQAVPRRGGFRMFGGPFRGASCVSGNCN